MFAVKARVVVVVVGMFSDLTDIVTAVASVCVSNWVHCSSVSTPD